MLDNGAIRSEFKSIIANDLPGVFWRVETDIIADNSKEVRVRNTVSMKTASEFISKVGDHIFITVQVGASVYKRFIQPNRDRLKVRVKRTVQNNSGYRLSGTDAITDTYAAFLIDAVDYDMASNVRGDETDGIAEVSNMLMVTLQLVEIPLLTLRNKETSGIYHDATPLDVLTSQLCFDLEDNSSVSALKKADYRGVKGFSAVPATNNKGYKDLIVPTGTRLTKLPEFLQKQKGIYSSGIGCYYRRGLWYIYPLFDYSRFSKAKKTLSVLNIPPEELPSIDKSFTVRSEQVFVLATGGTSVIDKIEEGIHNVGDSVRYVPSSKLDGKMYDTSNNKTQGNGLASANTIGVVSSPQGSQNTKYVDTKYTDNPYSDLSEVAAAQGQQIKFQWTNADPSLVYPGMPVRYYYLRGNEVESLDGTVLGSTSVLTPDTGLISDNTYRVNMSIVIHVKRK